MDQHYVYLKICDDLAQLSKCLKHKVGALIIKDNKILSTGVNGSVPGSCNCCDVFADSDLSSATFKNDHRIWSEKYEVHAEINALLRAGEDAQGGTLYCSLEPCFNCTKAALAAGIKNIFYARRHKSNLNTPEMEQFASSIGAEIRHIYQG